MAKKRIDITKNFCRRRIQNPKKFDKRSFRVKKPNKNTIIVVACPKGKFSVKKNRCNVGLRTQSIGKKKVNGRCPRI